MQVPVRPSAESRIESGRYPTGKSAVRSSRPSLGESRQRLGRSSAASHRPRLIVPSRDQPIEGLASSASSYRIIRTVSPASETSDEQDPSSVKETSF